MCRQTRSSMPRLVSEKVAARCRPATHNLPPLGQLRMLPKPMDLCGLFDTKAVDLALDRLSGICSPTNALDAWRERRRAS